VDGEVIKTVANVTHADIAEFLPIAAQIPMRPVVETYPLEEANRALLGLKHGPVSGAKVLQLSGTLKGSELEGIDVTGTP
jgi:propanol-preferring alcohol dehydrogenase